jgi:hypothetical protein
MKVLPDATAHPEHGILNLMRHFTEIAREISSWLVLHVNIPSSNFLGSVTKILYLKIENVMSKTTDVNSSFTFLVKVTDILIFFLLI